MLRQIERANAGKPRIGDSATRRDEYVDLGQDPYLEFPASNLASVAEREGRLKIIVKFLGLLGPQGALPLPTTDESLGWLLMRDDAFPRFLDLFNGRFLQLFFRAWSNSRPIGQHDRPSQDRFIAYIGSVIGLGTKPYSNLDSIPDIAKLEYAGLLAPKAKCASRLGRFLRGMFGVKVEIDEFVGSWLAFDPDDRTAIGRKHAALGKDMLLGSSVFSVEDKIRIRLYVKNFAQYEQFLPVQRQQPVQASRRRRVLLHRGRTRLGRGVGYSAGAGRAGKARSGRRGWAGRAGCRLTGRQPTSTGTTHDFI